MSKTFTKNIPVNEILHLGEHLEYKEGQVISITIAQNERLSITLFALEYSRITVGRMDQNEKMVGIIKKIIESGELKKI